MTWTYDNTDLSTETAAGRLNVVRLLVGDNDTLDEQIQDEEINFLLTQCNDNVYRAGSETAKQIAAKYSRLVTNELDGQLTMEYGDLANRYRDLADTLSDRAKEQSSSLTILTGDMLKSRIKRDMFLNECEE